MISQFSADGRETRYDPRNLTRWEAMDTDAFECWHGPLERWEGTVCFAREHGAVFLDRNLASYHNELREEIKAVKSQEDRLASALRNVANRLDEFRGLEC